MAYLIFLFDNSFPINSTIAGLLYSPAEQHMAIFISSSPNCSFRSTSICTRLSVNLSTPFCCFMKEMIVFLSECLVSLSLQGFLKYETSNLKLAGGLPYLCPHDIRVIIFGYCNRLVN